MQFDLLSHPSIDLEIPTNFIVLIVSPINQAASFGGTNIDPTAWEDKKCPGESRFPAQVSFFPHFSDGQSLARVSLAIWAMADDRRSAQHQTNETKSSRPIHVFRRAQGAWPDHWDAKKDLVVHTHEQKRFLICLSRSLPRLCSRPCGKKESIR